MLKNMHTDNSSLGLVAATETLSLQQPDHGEDAIYNLLKSHTKSIKSDVDEEKDDLSQENIHEDVEEPIDESSNVNVVDEIDKQMHVTKINLDDFLEKDTTKVKRSVKSVWKAPIDHPLQPIFENENNHRKSDDFSLDDLSINSGSISDDFDVMGSLETMSAHADSAESLDGLPKFVIDRPSTLPRMGIKSYDSIKQYKSTEALVTSEDAEKTEFKRKTRKCQVIILMVATAFLMLVSIVVSLYLYDNWNLDDKQSVYRIQDCLVKFSIFLVAVITLNSWLVIKILP